MHINNYINLSDKKYLNEYNQSFITSIVLNKIYKPPKINKIDWYFSLFLIVKELILIPNIQDGSLLFISKIKNDTNGDLFSNNITSILINILSKYDKFIIIDNSKIIDAYHTLGLIQEDNLECCSKNIWLGRYLNVKYLLYSIMSGDILQPNLLVKLILVDTGEIVWSKVFYTIKK